MFFHSALTPPDMSSWTVACLQSALRERGIPFSRMANKSCLFYFFLSSSTVGSASSRDGSSSNTASLPTTSGPVPTAPLAGARTLPLSLPHFSSDSPSFTAGLVFSPLCHHMLPKLIILNHILLLSSLLFPSLFQVRFWLFHMFLNLPRLPLPCLLSKIFSRLSQHFFHTLHRSAPSHSFFLFSTFLVFTRASNNCSHSRAVPPVRPPPYIHRPSIVPPALCRQIISDKYIDLVLLLQPLLDSA